MIMKLPHQPTQVFLHIRKETFVHLSHCYLSFLLGAGEATYFSILSVIALGLWLPTHSWQETQVGGGRKGQKVTVWDDSPTAPSR